MSTLDGADGADTSDERERSFGRSFRIHHRYRRLGYYLGLYGSATVLVAVLAFPLYWMGQSAFKTRTGIQEGFAPLPFVELDGYIPALTTENFTAEHFEIVFDSTVAQYFLNSVIVSVGTVVTVIVVSLIAGYGLARFDYRGKVATARFLLLGYMFSPIVLAIPLYLIWNNLGLLDRHVGLIIALSAISMPFAVWLMWKYIGTIPESMEESAWVSGASRWRAFRDIVVPQTKPAMIANAVFAFAIAWGDFTFSFIILPSSSSQTFPPGIFQMFNSAAWDTGWGEFMAVGLLVSLPPLLFAFFLQSYLLKGFKIRAL